MKTCDPWNLGGAPARRSRHLPERAAGELLGPLMVVLCPPAPLGAHPPPPSKSVISGERSSVPEVPEWDEKKPNLVAVPALPLSRAGRASIYFRSRIRTSKVTSEI